MILRLVRVISIVAVCFTLLLTARQYGEVVLPDDSTGQGPGTPPQAGTQICHGARRVWHVFLPSWYKFNCVLARSRYKVAKWPGISPGAEI